MTVKMFRYYKVWRAGLFLLLWWILTDGVLSSWWIGIPAVLLATMISIMMSPPIVVDWIGLLRFVPFFLLRSLLGGVDVARRAFQPNMPIAPDLFEYPLHLPQGLPRVLMANTVSLLPGTLSAKLENTVLTVHILDTRTDFQAELQAVEQNIARIFDIALSKTNEPQ